jgi:hypothetical protein
MRALLAFFGVFVIAAVVLRLTEVAGMRTCGCAEDCWCRRPGLDVFRWVVPVGHSSLDPDEKAARAD